MDQRGFKSLQPAPFFNRSDNEVSDMGVYWIGTEEGAPVKVGYTAESTPTARLSSLQTGNPARLQVFDFLEGGSRDEKILHASLYGHEISGEWFDYEAAMGIREAYKSKALTTPYKDPYGSRLDFISRSRRFLLRDVAKAAVLADRPVSCVEGYFISNTEFLDCIDSPVVNCAGNKEALIKPLVLIDLYRSVMERDKLKFYLWLTEGEGRAILGASQVLA